MKVAIFNVGFSPNLGDGVIALCLTREIERRTGWQVVSIDLAGRRQFSDPGRGAARVAKLAALQMMPRWLRDKAVEYVLGRTIKKRLRPQWRAMLSGARFVVFGGGQLFQDRDLNFPLKLAAAAAECEHYRLPLAVFAVGASPSQSIRGSELMRRLTGSSRVTYAAARDDQSRASLRQLGLDSKVCRDPGLLAASLWPIAGRLPRTAKVVGLGLTHPSLLAHHSSGGQSPSYEQAVGLYVAIVRCLRASGYDVLCFTNGAAEDERLLATLSRRMSDDNAGGHVRFAPRCKSPSELAAMIGACDAVVAHRLHAAILAYAYRVPAIGLLWDDKLEAFFRSVGREAYLVAFGQASARIGNLVAEALAEGIDAADHARVLEETEKGIEDLVQAIAAHARAPARDTLLEPGRYPVRDPAGEELGAASKWVGAA